MNTQTLKMNLTNWSFKKLVSNDVYDTHTKIPYYPYYPRYPRYPVYDYDYNYDLYQSQYSNIVQDIYNTGYMDRVYQNAYSNQVMYDRDWWW
jgi:hypothetical protein